MPTCPTMYPSSYKVMSVRVFQGDGEAKRKKKIAFAEDVERSIQLMGIELSSSERESGLRGTRSPSGSDAWLGY